MLSVKCTVCKKKFERKPSRVKNNNFCSCECYHLFLKGKKLSKKIKEKMSKSHKGLVPWNKGKTYDELYGYEKSIEIKRKIQENMSPRKKNIVKIICKYCNKEFEVKYKHRNRKYCSRKCSTDVNIGKKMPPISNETRRKMSIAKQGYKRKQSDEERKNRRLKFQEKFKEFDEWHPNFSSQACDYFKEFDKDNNTSGQYARNGGEFNIKELGYWVDYINHDLKLIMEYDEKYHLKQKQRDDIRQKEIQELYPDYEFRRIKE